MLPGQVSRLSLCLVCRLDQMRLQVSLTAALCRVCLTTLAALVSLATPANRSWWVRCKLVVNGPLVMAIYGERKVDDRMLSLEADH